MTPHSSDRFFGPTLICLTPVLAWAVQFGASYGFQHIACDVAAPPPAWVTIAVVAAAMAAATSACLLVMLKAGAWLNRLSSGEVVVFLAAFAKLLALLALIASALTGTALLVQPPCASLR
jgi:hypothetical protein